MDLRNQFVYYRRMVQTRIYRRPPAQSKNSRCFFRASPTTSDSTTTRPVRLPCNMNPSKIQNPQLF